MLIRDACYNQGMNGCYDSIVKVCEISLNRKSHESMQNSFMMIFYLRNLVEELKKLNSRQSLRKTNCNQHLSRLLEL